jgi:hypothetical protein
LTIEQFRSQDTYLISNCRQEYAELIIYESMFSKFHKSILDDPELRLYFDKCVDRYKLIHHLGSDGFFHLQSNEDSIDVEHILEDRKGLIFDVMKFFSSSMILELLRFSDETTKT